MKRRDFLRTAGGATAAGVAGASAAPAAAQGAKTVAVGPGGDLVFDPETVYVKKDGTVTWEWKSDTHNIVVESQPDEADWQGTKGAPSKTYDTGHTYEHTFEVLGEYQYFCQPHKTAGMVGTVVVNETGQPPGGGGGEGGGEKEPEEMGVPIRAHYVGAGAILATAITLVFTFFQLKYGESPHASGGGN